VKVEQIESDLDHWTLYLYAMKSPVTRDKYQKRLGKFFDFLRLEGITIVCARALQCDESALALI
jgi:hypothetical protein